MRGRRVLMESLVSHGVRHIFGNPGTTETPLLDSLLAYPQIDYVMTLHEGVAVGAASFYAQASGRTPVANLHVAPGLGNAIGSLYGALKANSPLVVTAGQQDTRMRLTNPLLSHDLVSMAAPVTKWSVQVERADEIAPILRRAFKVATDQPKGPVFVSLPIDVMEQETSVEAIGPDKLWRSPHPDPNGLEQIALLLLKSENPAIVAGDDVAQIVARRGEVAESGEREVLDVVGQREADRCVDDVVAVVRVLEDDRIRLIHDERVVARPADERVVGGRGTERVLTASGDDHSRGRHGDLHLAARASDLKWFLVGFAEKLA